MNEDASAGVADTFFFVRNELSGIEVVGAVAGGDVAHVEIADRAGLDGVDAAVLS